jgi:hypothetical protein
MQISDIVNSAENRRKSVEYFANKLAYLGYRAVNMDKIKTCVCTYEHSVIPEFEAAFGDSVKRELAEMIGLKLLEAGAIKFSFREEDRRTRTAKFVAEAEIIFPSEIGEV